MGLGLILQIYQHQTVKSFCFVFSENVLLDVTLTKQKSAKAMNHCASNQKKFVMVSLTAQMLQMKLSLSLV